jgi:hypothetical protein
VETSYCPKGWADDVFMQEKTATEAAVFEDLSLNKRASTPYSR